LNHSENLYHRIIFTEDTVRKWWLAKGIGIIQLEYNAFDFPLTATLYDTNIFTFYENSQAKKVHRNYLNTGKIISRKYSISHLILPKECLNYADY